MFAGFQGKNQKKSVEATRWQIQSKHKVMIFWKRCKYALEFHAMPYEMDVRSFHLLRGELDRFAE